MKNKKIIRTWLAAILFGFGFTISEQLIRNGKIFVLPTIIFSLSIIFTVIPIWAIFAKIISYNSNKPASRLKKSIIPSFLLFVFSSIIISLAFFGLGIFLVHLIKGIELKNVLTEMARSLPQAFKFLSAGLILAYGGFFYVIWQQAIQREQQVREENLVYKYRNLKSQVNPHFLFNSLNTLSEIIYTDTKQADNYIRKLASIYRYILDHEETDLVPLNEEIEFIQKYFDLQKERSGDKIELIIDFNDTEKFRIIPVSLQILVENAVKHNAASSGQPLIITLRNDKEYVEVCNPIQKKNTLENSSGTGLNNLAERVKLITGKEMIVNRDENRFTVKLPIIVQEK